MAACTPKPTIAIPLLPNASPSPSTPRQFDNLQIEIESMMNQLDAVLNEVKLEFDFVLPQLPSPPPPSPIRSPSPFVPATPSPIRFRIDRSPSPLRSPYQSPFPNIEIPAYMNRPPTPPRPRRPDSPHWRSLHNNNQFEADPYSRFHHDRSQRHQQQHRSRSRSRSPIIG